MEASCIFNLEYSFVLDPSTIHSFRSDVGLWSEYQNDDVSYRMIDNLLPLHTMVNRLNSCQTNAANYITISDPDLNNQLITISIFGNTDFINNSRYKLLQSYNQMGRKTIELTAAEFNKINSQFHSKLLHICNQYQIEMVINNGFSGFGSNFHRKLCNAIEIFGNQDNITIGETCVRILIDNLIYGYFVDSIDIDLSLIPILGGVDLFNFNQIAKQANSNIYVPDLLCNLYNNNGQGKPVNNKTSIWITAKDIPEILITKHIINNLIMQRTNPEENNGKGNFIVKEIDLVKVKLDLLTLYNQSQLLAIMFNHGVFIQLPSLGEQNNFKIMVQGYSHESVNDAISELNLLVTDYYTLHINKKLNSQTSLQSRKMEQYYLLQLQNLKKTCIITATKYGIEINSNSQEMKQVLSSLSTFKESYTSIKLRFELANSQRDFISGKKNGKLIKILNQLNQLPTIKFKPYNDYNFYVDFEIFHGTDISYMVRGLSLLEMELPAELQFNIPEVFHKSIIGNGGSIIQAIMKKYNVFIKFSSFTNTKKDIYSFKRYNNVLIKCPRKNSKNIKLVKYDIDQLVHQCCMAKNLPNYHTEYFKLLKSHYLLIINHNKLKLVNELESEFNCFINFPCSVEEFSNRNHLSIEITGSDSKISQCIEKLKTILSQNYEFKLTFNPGKFEDNLKDSHEFRQRIVIPFKILLGVEISVEENVDNCHQILLSYYNCDINRAINDLTLYLREKGFLIFEKKPYQFEPVVKSSYQSYNLPLQPITNIDTRLEKNINLLPKHYNVKGIW